MPKKSARTSRSKKVSARMKAPRRSHKKIARTKKIVFVFLGGAVALLFAVVGLSLLAQKPFCANSISCVKDLSGTYENGVTTGQFEGKTVSIPEESKLSYTTPAKNVLGIETGPKQIRIDLTHQHLYALEGNNVVMDFPISSGKWSPTPTGTFNIWIKLRYTRMTGGSGPDFYDLPNVPYTMYFYGGKVTKADGYGIHGAYWHNNFGHPMSHGCVNMRIADAGELYAWADPPAQGNTTFATQDNPGTQVVIYGTTPSE